METLIPKFIYELAMPMTASISTETYIWARFIFLRILGVGTFFSFYALKPQLLGLIGKNGICPINETLQHYSKYRFSKYLRCPTLFWLSSSDRSIRLLPWIGMTIATLLILNIAPKLCILAIWILFLSFVSVGNTFSKFQSDNLVLETLFLAFFIAPFGLSPGFAIQSPPSMLMVGLVWFLCFRLIIESGICKLITDPKWRDLSAMTHYYENCPFPTWIGWYIQKLPRPFHVLTCAIALTIECCAPLLILLGTIPRISLFFIWRTFQLLILLTGNYTFLNYTAISISFFFLPDAFLFHVLEWAQSLLNIIVPTTLHITIPHPITTYTLTTTEHILHITAIPIAILIIYNAILLAIRPLHKKHTRLTKCLLLPVTLVRPFHICHFYSFFATMPIRRLHLQFEGSWDNGKTWQAYTTKWQAHSSTSKPGFMAPHFPRFDWKLWQASANAYTLAPFIQKTAHALLAQKDTVHTLFETIPTNTAPTHIKVRVYQFSFSSQKSQKNNGYWWNIQDLGDYSPIWGHSS